MNYTEIQNEVIKKYRVDLCDGTKCKDGDWSRTHAHPRQRRVCKWKQANSIVSTLTLLHEIGHIETTTSKMRRCESEYHATVWAINILKEYGIADRVSDKQKTLYQEYIFRELDRGLRRGGKGLPTKEELTLNWGTERATTSKPERAKRSQNRKCSVKIKFNTERYTITKIDPEEFNGGIQYEISLKDGYQFDDESSLHYATDIDDLKDLISQIEKVTE